MDSGAMPQRVAVVSGATGVAGAEVVSELLQAVDKDTGARLYTGVYVLTRRTLPASMLLHRKLTTEEAPLLHAVQVDLLNHDSSHVGEALKSMIATTAVLESPPSVDLVYSAMYEKGKAPLGRFNLIVVARRSFQLMNATIAPIRAAVNCLPEGGTLFNSVYGLLHASSGAGHGDENMSMLVTAVEACRLAGVLSHVSLLTGGKMYGMHVHPAIFPGQRYPIPFEESTRGPSCATEENFYFRQEQYLASLSKVKYTVARPSYILGLPPPCVLFKHSQTKSTASSSMSFGLNLAAFCAMHSCCSNPSNRLPFPGSFSAATAKMTWSSSKDIATILSAQGVNDEDFNVISCTPFSWEEVWPSIAKFWHLDPEVPSESSWAVGMSGGVALEHCTDGEDLSTVWDRLVAQKNLRATDWGNMFNEDFFDKVLTVDWDTPQCPRKCKQHNLPHGKDTEAAALIIEFFEDLIAKGILPPPSPRLQSRQAGAHKNNGCTSHEISPPFIVFWNSPALCLFGAAFSMSMLWNLAYGEVGLLLACLALFVWALPFMLENTNSREGRYSSPKEQQQKTPKQV
jgi:hypothetical protein